MTHFFSVENLEQFLEKNPDSLAFAHLAARLIDDGEFQKAIDICNKGLAKNPHYSFGHFILGTAHYHIKNYTDAKKELEKALAYDPNNPRAWEILSAINDILNLNDDSRESNLQSYLIDSLNKDASVNYLPSQESPSFDQSASETAVSEETLQQEGSPSVEKDTGREVNLEEILDTVVESGEEEYDFEKALNEVFRNTDSESTADTGEEKPTGTMESPAEEEKPELDEDEIVSADEFTSAIESFFKESREDSPESEIPEEQVSGKQEHEDVQHVKPDEETIFEELSPDQDEIPEEKDQVDQETDELTTGEEKPEKTPDDEFLDFTTFVSDVIKDDEEKIEEDKDSGFEELSLPEDEQEPGMVTEDFEEPEKKEPSIPENEIDFPKEEDFDSAVLPGAEERSAVVPDESPQDTDVPEEPVQEKSRSKFVKPPILSPTLGEIYIAQGRFEEAIEVFNQLLDKDPENSRFKRKIEDLQKIMLKKKMGSG